MSLSILLRAKVNFGDVKSTFFTGRASSHLLTCLISLIFSSCGSLLCYAVTSLRDVYDGANLMIVNLLSTSSQTSFTVTFESFILNCYMTVFLLLVFFPTPRASLSSLVTLTKFIQWSSYCFSCFFACSNMIFHAFSLLANKRKKSSLFIKYPFELFSMHFIEVV